jgi:putative addiction module killer protein
MFGFLESAMASRASASLRNCKAQLDNLGDIKSVGAGVFEMRENFGPSWRLYYLKHGKVLIVMLGGGA